MTPEQNRKAMRAKLYAKYLEERQKVRDLQRKLTAQWKSEQILNERINGGMPAFAE